MNRRLFLSSVAVLPLVKPAFLSTKTFLNETFGIEIAYSFIGDGVSSPYKIVYKITDGYGKSLYSKYLHDRHVIDYTRPGLITPPIGKIFALNSLNFYREYSSPVVNNARIFECISKSVSPGLRLNLDEDLVEDTWQNNNFNVFIAWGVPTIDLAKTVYCDSLEVRRELTGKI